MNNVLNEIKLYCTNFNSKHKKYHINYNFTNKYLNINLFYKHKLIQVFKIPKNDLPIFDITSTLRFIEDGFVIYE